MDHKTLIKVNCLSKHYQMGEITVKALEKATFSISEGEFIVILGPSGSGKSTLLNILGGMDKPTKGKVNQIQKRSNRICISIL